MINIIRDLFPKKERFLGVSKNKRRYDLPLDNNAGNKFIKMLIALMTILLMLSLSGAFALSEIANRWSSGLEGKATIEIPAKDLNGVLLTPEDIQKQAADIKILLEDNKIIKEASILKDSDIIELVRPWLGDTIDPQTTTLPSIISLSFHKQAEENINHQALEMAIKKIAPQARLDTHKNWLSDILKLTRTLRFSAYIIILVISLTTIIAIAGAVRTRLSAYKEELELLHLVGADDNYISKQLQRHTIILTLQGSLLGLIIGGALLLIINQLLSTQDLSLLPDFTLSRTQKSIIALLPVFIGLISMQTARFTVLRTLSQMP